MYFKKIKKLMGPNLTQAEGFVLGIVENNVLTRKSKHTKNQRYYCEKNQEN